MATASSVSVHAHIHREREAAAEQRTATCRGVRGWLCRWTDAGRLVSRPDRSQQGFTLIELMIVMGVLAILLAIALPSYNAFVARGKVSECMNNATDMKLSISETTMSMNSGAFPADATIAGIEPVKMGDLQYCDAALYANTGVLTLQVDEAAVGVTGTIEMVLVPTFAGRSIIWDCQPGATSSDALRYLPSVCRT